MEYQIIEIGGTEFATLEECQAAMLDQLARLLAGLICQEFASEITQECDTIGLNAPSGFLSISSPELLEVVNV